MGRVFFDVEKGYVISSENGDELVRWLAGSGAPLGTSGDTDTAPIGSFYSRTDGSGGLYKKTANTSSASDWEEVGNVALDTLNWRNEKVVALTNDTISAGSNIDGTAWTDNDDGFTPVVGQYVIGDADGTPALFEITAVVSPSDFDLAAASQAIADNDTFIVQNYLPDPAGQENQAIFHVPTAGSAGVKIADVDWSIADAINLASGYTPGSGDITNADTVNSAIEKLDGNNDAQDTLLGTSQGDTDLGTFTGSTISDNTTVKNALQELETALEAIEVEASVNVPAATPTAVLPALVDGFNYIEYEVWVYEQGDETQAEGFKFTVFHDGTTSSDATDGGTDNSVSNKHKINKIAGLTVDHVLSGTGASQTVAMEISATNALTVKVRRTAISF